MFDFDVNILTVGPLQTNCYIVTDLKSKKSIIIDPGDAGDFISAQLQKDGFVPTKIVATHGHFDHISAATYLRLNYKIPFFVNKKDEFLIERMRETAKHFAGVDPGPNPKIDGFIKNGDEISIGRIKMKAIWTPGHTPGSMSFLIPGYIFVGDLISFGGQKGSAEHKYQSKIQLQDSIEKVMTLPDNTQVFSGHGPTTTIGAERKLLSVGA